MECFTISYWYEEQGSTQVMAKNKKEAEKLVFKELEANGTEYLENVNLYGRDYGIS
jgi:hypothetical protein